MKLKEIVSKIGREFGEKTPEILTGISIAGLISTMYLCYKAGPVAKEIIKRRKEEYKEIGSGKENQKKKMKVLKESAKELIPVVAPSIVMGTVTGGCIIGSNKASNKKIALLSTAYSVSKDAVKDLNEKMEEVLGDKKAKLVKDKIAEDKLKKSPYIFSNGEVYMDEDFDVPCKDLYTGAQFRSNSMKIKEVLLKLSERCKQEMFISLNDLRLELGMESVPMGRDIGWNVDDLVCGVHLPITLTSCLSDTDIPILCLDYTISKRNDYTNLH